MSAFHADALDVPGGSEREPARVPEVPLVPTRAETVRALQGTAGNQAVARMLKQRAGRNTLHRWDGEVMDRARARADAEREYDKKRPSWS